MAWVQRVAPVLLAACNQPAQEPAASNGNNAPYTQDVHLAGATVTVDGAALVDKGELKP